MDASDPRHGTNSGYVNGRCRQECCRNAHAQYANRYRMGQRPGKVSSVGTRRRVRALMRLGWTSAQIAHECGLQRRHTISDLTDETRLTVLTTTAKKVAKAYDRLSMQIGPSERTRARAERAGWPPPLAYDDDQIDDPGYRPTRRSFTSTTNQIKKRKDVDEAVVVRVLGGEFLPTSRAERFEIMRRWLASGGSERELAGRMGWREGRYAPSSVGHESHSGGNERGAA